MSLPLQSNTPMHAALPLSDPRCADFLKRLELPPPGPHGDLESWWQALPWDLRNDCGWNLERLSESLRAHLACSGSGERRLSSIEILPGRDKQGVPERFHLRFEPGDVVCLVGPTGAGKSRLLADIECLAQGDTPSGRRVLIDGMPPPPERRFSGEDSLVAQITQNMNFVMDLAVGDFLALHAESRGLPPDAPAVARVLEAAIGMAGEPFSAATPLTQLSGGQSRALMIADAAFLSPKPVVLIDEIENAGIDRSRALALFVDQGKIVLLSTHDPLLALTGKLRLVIRNGAVQDVIEPSDEERRKLSALKALDQTLVLLRERLRHGERLDTPLSWPD